MPFDPDKDLVSQFARPGAGMGDVQLADANADANPGADTELRDEIKRFNADRKRATLAPSASAGMGDVKLAESDSYLPKQKPTPVVSVSRPSAANNITFTPAPSLASMAPTSPPRDLVKAFASKSDDDLAKAQHQADMERTLSHAGGVIDRGARLSIGAPTDGEVFARGEQEAGQRVLDLLQRRDQAQKAAAEQEHRDISDPTSDVSKRATMLARSQGLIGPTDVMTAAEWNEARQGAGVQAQREAAAANNRLAEAQFGYQRQHDANELAFRRQEAAANREFQKDLHLTEIDAQHRAKLEEEEAKRRTSGPGALVAPGFARGDVPVKDEELAKFRTALTSQKDLESTAAELRQLVKDHGTEQLPTAAKRRMESLVAKLKVQVKNIDALGALSGSDYTLLDNQVPDPTSLFAMSSGNIVSSLDQLVDNGRSTLSSGASALGLQRTQPQASKSPLKSGEVVMLDPQGRPHAVAADEAAEAEKHGWRRR